MAWIEVHQSLRRHPKTGRLRRALGISRATAVGHLVCLWTWALEYADSGDLGAFSAEDLAEAAGWPGDAAAFVAALEAAGFLDPGRLLHDWRDYAGRLLEQRAAAAERMRRVRERSRNVPARSQPTGTGTGTKTGTGDRTGDRGEAGAAAAAQPPLQLGPQLQPVPKPARARAVVARIKAAGVPVSLTARDREALAASDAPAEDVADAYVGLFEGQWGDDFDRGHLSVRYVVEHLGGYYASRAPAAPPKPARDPRRYIEGPLGRLVQH